MKFIFTLFLFLLSTTFCISQSSEEAKSVNLTSTVRVDLVNEEIKKVFDLWKSYLSTSPQDSIGANFWSKQQKEIFRDTDLTRALINYSLLSHYEPHILSIEQKNDLWEIRTLYLTKSQEERFQSSNPWAIQTVFAGYEDKELKLFNSLQLRTSNWKSSSLGDVIYYYPPEFTFAISEAEKTQDFIDKVTKEFKLNKPEQIFFYLSDHPDDIMYILGFDYILGTTFGYANVHNNMILSGFGSAWYPHEIAHLLFKEFETSHFLSEGIATMLGGTQGYEPEHVYKKLKQFLEERPEVTLSEIMNTQFFDGTNLYFYAAGATVCEIVFREYGPQKLISMLSKVRSNEDLYPYLRELEDNPAIDIEDWWKRFVVDLEYQHN